MEAIKAATGIQLDIGCGGNKQAGFVGIDMRPLDGVDLIHDLEDFPWPLDDESVLRAICSHVVEHINPHKGTFVRFMDEVWRVLKPGGQFAIVTPYATSAGFYQDPTHCNPCNEVTWAYFDPNAHGGALYSIYRPKPWRIADLYWVPHGNMEVLLVKSS